jgi:beta-lactam-binding protein with PASTA domain
MKQLLRGLGIFFTLIGVGVISAVTVLALLLRQEEVRVPALVGQEIVTVIEELNQQGLQLKVDSRQSNPTLAPKVEGEAFRKADVLIRQAGFFPGTQSRVFSDTVDRDVVIAQDPKPGSPLDRGGKVDLLISAGKKPVLLVMPKLTGKKAQEAARIADRMGLQYRLAYKGSGDASSSDRVVIRQKPNAGAPVAADATVEITVGK